MYIYTCIYICIWFYLYSTFIQSVNVMYVYNISCIPVSSIPYYI